MSDLAVAPPSRSEACRSEASQSQARTPPERVGARLLVGLIAGRSSFRVLLYGANLALLAAWGHRVFDRYAAASGALILITALAQSGPEKAALKLIPRARRTRDGIVAGLLRAVRLVPLVMGCVAAIALGIDRHGTATLYIAEAAESAAIGFNAVAVAVRRSLGTTSADIFNFALLSMGWVCITALAIVTRADPAVYVFVQFLLVVAITEVTTAGQRRPVHGVISRPRLWRVLAGTVALIGMYDLVTAAAASGVFVVLRVTRFANQSGDLYLALGGWAVALSFFIYVLRVFQPQVSVCLAGKGRLTGRQRVGSLGRWALAVNIAWLVGAGSLIATSHIGTSRGGLAPVVALLVLLVSQAPVFMLTATGVYLLENLDGGSLRAAAVGGAAGLALVIIASVAVIPSYGAAGAIWALAAMDTGQAIVLVRQGTARVTAPVGAT